MNKFLKIIVMFTFMFPFAFARNAVTLKVNIGKQVTLGNFYSQADTLFPAGGVPMETGIKDSLELLIEQFTEQTSISLTGVTSSSVAWGDYDNDGDLDILLTGQANGGSVSKIYKNNGNGTFTEQTSISLTGVSQSSVAWGDYDNDGDLDILLTGSDPSKIYKNNGDGTFTEQTAISLAGVSSGSGAWGDYDNDGDLDILLTSAFDYIANRKSKIYKNNGDGTFTEQTSISLPGGQFSSAEWGDYDNDGDLDILLTDGVSKIYKNNGDGTFTEQTSISLPGGTVAWGDYDNDGDLDILLAGGVSKIYKNNGDGTFTEQTSISLMGLISGSVAWGDYDNDGDLDILLTGLSGNVRVSKIYKNNGDGTFTEQTSIFFEGVYNSSVAWGDYDNDGDLDILLTGWDSYNIPISKIYKNNNAVLNTVPNAPTNLTSNVKGDSVTFNWNKSTDNETPQNGLHYNIVIGTTANSVNTLSPMANRTTGFRRVVRLGNSQTNSWTIKNLPGGTYYWSVQAIDAAFAGSQFASTQTFTVAQQFTEQTSIPLTDVYGSSVAWGDYDNDGDLDILLTGYDGINRISKIYKNNGDGTFTEQTSISLTGVDVSSAAWGDYDNDGDLDILLTGYAGSVAVSKIYKNNGDGTFTEQTSILLQGVQSSSVAWGDYDNDGNLDILLTGSTGNGYISKIYKNNGDGTFTEQTSISLTGVGGSSLAWGDYDNDGNLDILLTGSTGNGYISKIYKNNGNGTFTDKTSISLAGVYYSSVAWGDYDNDGDLDILLTGYAGSVAVSKIYKNNGDGTFTEQTAISLTGVAHSSVAWGDYDNDGNLDILLTGSTGNGYISKIYKNNGNGTFTDKTSISLAGVYYSSVAWGDYDNDGDLDILLTGYNSSNVRISKIYKNNNAVLNTVPNAPTNLTSTVNGNTVTFNWSKSTDNETLQNGLHYNLVIGTTANSVNTLSPMANRTTGFRRVVRLGISQTNSWTIKNLPGGTYYWSVQAIDGAFAGSQFAPVNSFDIIPIPAIPTLATPLDGAIDQSLTPTLTWNQVSGATSYRLQVSTNSGFTSLVYNDSTLTTTSKTLPAALTNSTQYYWRVSAKNGGGTSGYSTSRTFRTVPAVPSTPILVSPLDGAIDQSLTPTLTWNAVSGASTYRLQVSTNSGFTSFVFNDSTLTTNSKTLPNELSFNTMYFWRVNSKNAGGTSGYSSQWSFVTRPNDPSIPNLLTPFNGSIDQSLTPKFTWNAVSGASSYRLQVSTNSGFTSLVYNDSTITTTSKTLPTALSFNTLYYWRVNAKNAGGTGGYSSSWSFRTIPAVPSTPTLLSPLNGAIDQSVTPTLTWNTVSGASTYRLQVSTNSGFTSLVYNDSTITTTSKTLPTALSFNTLYYWRVNAKNAGGTGGYSSSWSFRTIPAVPSTPTLISPENGAIEQSVTPSLTWNSVSGTSTYRLQVSTNSGFTSFVFDDSTLTTTSKTLQTALSNNTLYYWRVSAKNAGGTSGYSSVWSFTTIPAVPATPILLAPLNSAIDQSVTPSLTWNSVSGASKYRLQVSTNSGFTSFVYDDSTITETSKTLPAALANNTIYYWRVSAKNSGGTSGYSTSWTFTTITAIPTAPTLATPLDGAIEQSITPTLAWNSVSGAVDYRLQISTDSTFASTLFDETGLTGTTKNVSNLSYNKIYFWRISARNSAGTSGWSQKFRFSTIKPTISLITPNGGENMAVGRTYQISWSSQFVQGVKLELSTNNGIGWISITSLGTGVQSYNWTIPSGTVSTSCKVRISDETDASINDISSTAFTIFEYPSVIEVSKQVSFSGTTENSYRMVGLPGNITIPVTSVITGTQKTDWQAYRDNGVISTNRADYLIEHTASNPLSFTLGRGLWVLSKNVFTVSRQESSAAINDSSYALVPLQSNWNIITNPFNRVIQWNRVLTANSITKNDLLYSFNGSWVNNTSAMTPYEGYLFFNFHGLTTLKIPYDPNGSLAKGNFAPLPLKISDNKISLSLVQGSEVKSNLMAAIDASASEDFDSTDYFAPPSSFEDVSIIIKNQNLTTAYKSLFAESRPMNGDGQIFDLQLKNVTGEELKFDFTGMDKFKDYEVYLFDSRLKKYYNLKEKNNILSPAYVREGKFSLLIGKSSFIECEKAKNIVNEYSLLQNYPNPFNPKTVIMYSLKAPSNVVLMVYDITGSMVAKLVDGYLSEGYHEAVFNADNLASGIYIYRLEVKNGNNMVYTSTRKMVVTK